MEADSIIILSFYLLICSFNYTFARKYWHNVWLYYFTKRLKNVCVHSFLFIAQWLYDQTRTEVDL